MTSQPSTAGPDESPGMEVAVVSIKAAGSCCDCPMIFAALNTAAEHALKRGHRVDTVVETRGVFTPVGAS